MTIINSIANEIETVRQEVKNIRLKIMESNEIQSKRLAMCVPDVKEHFMHIEKIIDLEKQEQYLLGHLHASNVIFAQLTKTKS